MCMKKPSGNVNHAVSKETAKSYRRQKCAMRTETRVRALISLESMNQMLVKKDSRIKAHGNKL